MLDLLNNKPKVKDNFVLILVSGGIDSTACIKYYLDLNYNVSLLFIDYGQKSSKKEYIAIEAISNFFEIDFETIKIKKFNTFNNSEIIGRNAFFLTTALMHFNSEYGIIAIGIHMGTNYKDCSPEFMFKMQALFDLYTNGKVILEAPFLKWNKLEIWNHYNHEGFPMGLTYSCELGKKQPCGKCKSCQDLKVLYES